ncbi:uncharacterized protein LOC115256378 [Aedes albopictus]|uniref:Secreted protein n=1 Tax=Aedes albopictus TaxID=7160 RepID=A0ABM1XXA6_AEDAL|nr:uncharacterized protein LOC115256378 [Aedes albopictus]
MDAEFTNVSIETIICTGPTRRYIDNFSDDDDEEEDTDEVVIDNLKFDKVTFSGGLLPMMAPIYFEELQHTCPAIVSKGTKSSLPIEDSDATGQAAQSDDEEESKKKALEDDQGSTKTKNKTDETLKSDATISDDNDDRDQ